ncbi:hypothetical protein [Streptodolium elevatio]|uniref:Uncharacterized protein n=1 Tax=Streptodolium elevatio TaxID=3157996 RepID=A0ABV3DY66_9ACTN
MLDALGLQDDAARVLVDGLRAPIDELRGRLRETESTSKAWRSPGRPSRPHRPVAGRPAGPARAPDGPRILGIFNDATGPLRANDVCDTLDHERLPKNIEGTRSKLKRLVKLGLLNRDRHRQLHREVLASIRDQGPLVNRCQLPSSASHSATTLVDQGDVVADAQQKAAPPSP